MQITPRLMYDKPFYTAYTFAGGVLYPLADWVLLLVIAAAAMNLSPVLVIANALRLKTRIKRRLA